MLAFIVCTLLPIMHLCPVYCYCQSYSLTLYNLLMIYLFPCSKTTFHTHIVICPVLPVTKISAFPSGSLYSLTGTSSTAARYSTLGSKKMQGSLSWMQDNSRPFALIGPLGITICSNKNSQVTQLYQRLSPLNCQCNECLTEHSALDFSSSKDLVVKYKANRMRPQQSKLNQVER